MKRSNPPRRRNPLAFNPMMRKGGVHEKSNKAKRQAEKRKTRRQVENSTD